MKCQSTMHNKKVTIDVHVCSYMYTGVFLPNTKDSMCISIPHSVGSMGTSMHTDGQVCVSTVCSVCQQSVVGIMSFARFCANSCCVWVKRLVGSLMVSAVLSPRYCVSMFSLPLSVPLGLSFVLSDVSTVFPVTHCVLWFSSVCCSICLCMRVCAYVPFPVST